MKIKLIGAITAVAISSALATCVIPMTGLAATKPPVSVSSFLINNNVAFSYYNKQQELEKKLYEQEQQRKSGDTSSQGFTKLIDRTTTTGSLRLSITNDSPEVMTAKINNFLSGTPMHGKGAIIVSAGIKNNIAPSIIAAIAMQESTGGEFTANSYNAWGRKAVSGGWAGWSSWTQAINNEANYLSKYYLDEGLDTINKISYKYCPTPRGQWESGVSSYQKIIANE